MNLAVLTLNGHFNYGNRLQNYALTRYLKQFGSSQCLWWSGEYELFTKKTFSFKEKIKFLINYKEYQKRIVYNDRIDFIRQYMIKSFTDKHIDVCEMDLTDYSLCSIYDYYIVGSDQVWNPLFWSESPQNEYAMFLKFANPSKRIAYAASLGLNQIPDRYKSIFQKNIEGVEHISVRENAAANIIESLTGRRVPVLIDPTLLIPSSQWELLEKRPSWYRDEEYILTYFLGNIPEFISRYAKQNKYKIYNLMDINNIDIYVSRVEEFLYLIHHAKLFCTDSFHGCVFSILFKTPFMVTNRQQYDVPNIFSRLETLLSVFGFKDQFCNFSSSYFDFDKYMFVDFSRVEDILFEQRSKSYNFFSEIFGNNEKVCD